MKSIFLGPYMSGLNQYAGVGKGSVLSEIFVSLTNDPPNPFGQHDIENMLTSLTILPDGRLLNPERDSQLLCCVFTPPDWKSTDAEANGYHTFFLSNGGAVPYAWISNDGTLDFVSSVYSHELAEACTDPVDAFYDNTGACGQMGGPWRGPAVVGVELGELGALSLIHSNFSSSNSGVGNLELVAMAASQLVHFWREDNIQIAGGDTRSWFGPWLVTS